MARILIVEDEAHLAAGIRFNLEAEGYDAEVEADGAGALARLAGAEPRPPFDLVILDVMLPGVDGFAVADAMRKAGNFTPVLMLTARACPRTSSTAWRRAPTTTSPSPSTSPCSWPACAACCAGGTGRGATPATS